MERELEALEREERLAETQARNAAEREVHEREENIRLEKKRKKEEKQHRLERERAKRSKKKKQEQFLQQKKEAQRKREEQERRRLKSGYEKASGWRPNDITQLLKHQPTNSPPAGQPCSINLKTIVAQDAGSTDRESLVEGDLK